MRDIPAVAASKSTLAARFAVSHAVPEFSAVGTLNFCSLDSSTFLFASTRTVSQLYRSSTPVAYVFAHQ